MPRILLVDDEPLTTGTLQMLILDEMPEMEVYTVNSAVQALEMVNKNVYDVVVTDVSMPRISGLELLDHIKQQGSLCYVIVLTAYNSFDYAYKAAQYEDVRFILKIEPPEVIMEAIRAGLSRIRQYYSASEDNQRIRRYMRDTLPLLKHTLLERLLVFGEALPDQAIRESCGISVLPGWDTWLAVTGCIQDREKQQEIGFLVLSMLRDRGLKTDVWNDGTSLFFLIQQEEAGDLPALIRGPLDRIIEGVDPAVGLCFALSSAPVPWDRIGEAAFALAGYARGALESSRIEVKDPEAEEKRTLSLRDALRWRGHMEKRRLKELMAAVKDCLLREGYPEGRQSCGLLLEMLLRETFGGGCLDGLRVDGFSAETVLLHGGFDSLNAWLLTVEKLLESVFSGSSERWTTETEDMLVKVNRYIQEHYAEPISLTQIAEQFNYNSSYLSRIYKQNMREGLSEHIVRTRIEAACRLLLGGGMSVGEIAEQCGFQTTKYFITVFKRVKGLTPKAWREAQKTDKTTEIQP